MRPSNSKSGCSGGEKRFFVKKRPWKMFESNLQPKSGFTAGSWSLQPEVGGVSQKVRVATRVCGPEEEVGCRRSEFKSLAECASDSHKVMFCLHQTPEVPSEVPVVAGVLRMTQETVQSVDGDPVPK